MSTNRRTRSTRARRRGADVVQLRLLAPVEGEPEWTLDERTRRVGRRGVAVAREVLRQAQPPRPVQPVRRAS